MEKAFPISKRLLGRYVETTIKFLKDCWNTIIMRFGVKWRRTIPNLPLLRKPVQPSEDSFPVASKAHRHIRCAPRSPSLGCKAIQNLLEYAIFFKVQRSSPPGKINILQISIRRGYLIIRGYPYVSVKQMSWLCIRWHGPKATLRY